MLIISKPLSSSQAQTYHAKEFMSAEQNYWKQGDTIFGELQGGMAERYGRAGAIDELYFARLSEGQNPFTGEQLVRHCNGQEYTTADGTCREARRAPRRLGRHIFSAKVRFGDCFGRRRRPSP